MPDTTTPTPDDIAMAGMSVGDASKGDLVVGDGETACAGCDTIIPAGASIYWRCSMEMECDPYCGVCLMQEADSMRSICAAIESGELRP